MNFTKSIRVAAVAAAAVLASAGAQATVITNGLSSGTLGYWAVDVLGGGQTRTAYMTGKDLSAPGTLITTEVVYDYFTYLKVGSQGLQLSGGGQTLNTTNGAVESSGRFTGSLGNTINWTASSSIAAGSPKMVTVFDFTVGDNSNLGLGELSLFQYLDEDVLGVSDDVFFTRGAAATNNLELYTIDNLTGLGVSHSGALSGAQGMQHATFSGWAMDNYNRMKPRLENGTQAVSTGGTFSGPTGTRTNPYVGSVYGMWDIVSVAGWTVDATARSARIITTLGGVADATTIDDPVTVPEPAGIALAGLALAAMGAARRRRVQ